MRLAGALLICTLAAAQAGTPERDAAWDKLIAEAKAHGGTETRLEKTVSYVFQLKDGAYLSFTRLTKGANRRSVCLIAKEENATACLDWDSGKLTTGDRADAATPWKFSPYASLDAYEAAQPSLADKLFSAVGGFLMGGLTGGGGGHAASGYYRLSANGNWYWQSSSR